jgi:TRAP-type uncharacterized transport system fused permease subunit
VAIAAFTAASLAKTNAMATGFAAVRFGWIAYVVPVLFVFSPALLLHGSVGQVTLAAATAVVGVALVCAAVSGFMFRVMDAPTRIAAGLGGLALMIPANALPGGGWTDVGGLALGLAVAVKEFIQWRQGHRPLTAA